MSFRPKLRRLRRINRADCSMLVEAAVNVLVYRLIVIFLPLRHYASQASAASGGCSAPAELARRIGWSVQVAARHMPCAAACLPQALAARQMLARRGYATTLRLGVRLVGPSLHAHAWLQSGNTTVIGEAGVAGMVPIARFG
jgi:hypothetical protein